MSAATPARQSGVAADGHLTDHKLHSRLGNPGKPGRFPLHRASLPIGSTVTVAHTATSGRTRALGVPALAEHDFVAAHEHYDLVTPG